MILQWKVYVKWTSTFCEKTDDVHAPTKFEQNEHTPGYWIYFSGTLKHCHNFVPLMDPIVQAHQVFEKIRKIVELLPLQGCVHFAEILLASTLPVLSQKVLVHFT